VKYTTRIKFIADRLSFRIGDLTLMYEHKQVDPDDLSGRSNVTKNLKKLNDHKGDVKK
jgi:hypothetical protein